VRLEGLDQLKKSSDPIGNRTRDLQACSIVPQPTTLPRAPLRKSLLLKSLKESPHMPLLCGALMFRGSEAYEFSVCDVGENQRKYLPTGDVALTRSAKREGGILNERRFIRTQNKK
jgi:hypothetical protein